MIRSSVGGRARWRPVAAGMIAALALSACGISTDTAPRDITLGGQDDVAGDATAANAAGGEGQVYFVQVDTSGAPSRLLAVARNVVIGEDRDPTAVLDVLVDGPNPTEREASITTLLPQDLQLLGWTARGGGVITVDFSAELAELTGSNLIVALAQIVLTVTENTNVNGVRITVEGRIESWPDVNGQLQSDPLTVFDYPGLVRSSQPAYPAIPSGRPDGA